jgi:Spy/CpxP family protein refolding chaperone
MRTSLAAIVASLAIAATAYAQAPTTPAATGPATVAPAAAVPVPSSKRFACHTASQGLKGQEQRDQVQLCIAQARIDCLKQAIDQKIVGRERREFVKNCMD